MNSERDRLPRRERKSWSLIQLVVGLGLAPRDRHEANRKSSNLELLFDLATIVAVAAAVIELARSIQTGESGFGVARFSASFFMIWLAWSNYTWFASGYDNRSTAFRFLTLIIMFGSLTLAAGVQTDRGEQPIWLALIGFTIMRSCLIALWLGAALGDPRARTIAVRHAFGIGVLQTYWWVVITTVSPQTWLYALLFAAGVAGEIALPMLAKSGAEARARARWNYGHIIDRHRSFGVIVLGECFAAIAAIIAESSAPGFRKFWLGAICMAISFSMWQLYFGHAEHMMGRKPGDIRLWTHGHAILFAAGAATAGGFLVCLADIGNRAPVSESDLALAVGIPIALYLLTLWLMRERGTGGLRHWILPTAAVSIVLCSTLDVRPLEMVAALLAVSAWSAAKALPVTIE